MANICCFRKFRILRFYYCDPHLARRESETLAKFSLRSLECKQIYMALCATRPRAMSIILESQRAEHQRSDKLVSALIVALTFRYLQQLLVYLPIWSEWLTLGGRKTRPEPEIRSVHAPPCECVHYWNRWDGMLVNSGIGIPRSRCAAWALSIHCLRIYVGSFEEGKNNTKQTRENRNFNKTHTHSTHSTHRLTRHFSILIISVCVRCMAAVIRTVLWSSFAVEHAVCSPTCAAHRQKTLWFCLIRCCSFQTMQNCITHSGAEESRAGPLHNVNVLACNIMVCI